MSEEFNAIDLARFNYLGCHCGNADEKDRASISIQWCYMAASIGADKTMMQS